MMLDRVRVYKSLETDEELRARALQALQALAIPDYTVRYWREHLERCQNDALDDTVWETFKLQRRLVERASGR